MSEDKPEQKRKHPRIQSRVDIEFSSGESSYDGTMVNYSQHGVAVEFKARLGKQFESFEIGQDINLSTKNDVNLSANLVRNYRNGFAVEISDTENVMELLSSIVLNEKK